VEIAPRPPHEGSIGVMDPALDEETGLSPGSEEVGSQKLRVPAWAEPGPDHLAPVGVPVEDEVVGIVGGDALPRLDRAFEVSQLSGDRQQASARQPDHMTKTKGIGLGRLRAEEVI